MNLGEVLALKQDEIIRDWMAQVRCDKAIPSTDNLTYKGILDSLPSFLKTVTQLLSLPTSEVVEDLLDEGIEHGLIRAKQDYDAEEIIREYSILRNVMFEALEEALLNSESLLIMRAMRLVDGAIDRALALGLKCYTEERMRDINVLYDELLASNQELDWLVRNEQTNLAHLAHELKSPLSSIIGFSDLFLRQHAQSGEVHPRYIEQVRTGGRRMLESINQTLFVSSHKAGKIQLNLEPFQACEVVEEVTSVLKILAQQKGLSMSVDYTHEHSTIVTDKKRLRQVLTNLVSNAIRYTDTGNIHVAMHVLKVGSENSGIEQPERYGGHRTFEAAGSDHTTPLLSNRTDRIEISVADTGLGINQEDQGQIFEPYYQGKSGEQLACSTGLGLAITYQMVKLLQGSIYLHSEPGKGSTFTVALPMEYQPQGLGPDSA